MKFKSVYYENKLTAQQYIIEILLERQAKKQNVDLPIRYCDHEKWKRAFMQQLRVLSTILKYVSVECVLAALRDDEFKWVYSLHNSYFKKNIRRFYRSFEKNKELAQQSIIEPSGSLSKNSVGDFSKNKKRTGLDILDE